MRASRDLSNLIEELSPEDWQPLLEQVMDEHFGPAMEAFDLEFEEIDDRLGGNWTGTLWGCAFEDFLTRRFAPDERNPVEAYLERRGSKESAALRRYMTALQTSIMSLYEVSDITPGAVPAGARSDPGRRTGAGARAFCDAEPAAVGPDCRADRAERRSAGPGGRPSRLHPRRIGAPRRRPPGGSRPHETPAVVITAAP